MPAAPGFCARSVASAGDDRLALVHGALAVTLGRVALAIAAVREQRVAVHLVVAGVELGAGVVVDHRLGDVDVDAADLVDHRR